MSATLVAKGVAAGHGDRLLFDGLDLVVAPGDVIGLVGVNGAGKSTLLRTLAGLLAVEDGEVRLSPATATVGYLPQEPDRRPGETVRDFLARRTGVAEAQRAMDAAAEDLAVARAGADDAYGVALERWLALGGADLDDRAETAAAEVGLGVALEQEMVSLSGGQAARAGLASLLLSRYDVFLLDEPTNDLDLDGLARLEAFVGGLRAGVVVVSHDREFLARTVTAVLELDLHQNQTSLFGGGYQAYLEEREIARRHARERFEEFADTKAGLEERARTQRGWMEHGVRNARRKAKDNDKISRRTRQEATEKQASKARQTERMIERLEVVEEPRKEWELRMEIAAAPRAGAVVAALRDAVVRRGPFTLGPVTLEVGWADRVAITGANGAGKSTLLAALLGRAALDGGEAYLGPGVQVGEVDQARGLFLGDNRSPTPSSGRFPSGRPPTCAPCWPSSACAPSTSGARRRRSRPASGPGRRWRCYRRAGSTCSCSTSRPTTSTCPPSSSSRARWRPTRGPCCSSRTTAGCSTRSPWTAASRSWTGLSTSAADPTPRREDSSTLHGNLRDHPIGTVPRRAV